MIKELIDLVGGKQSFAKVLIWSAIVTAYLAAVYFVVCAVIPFR